MHHKLKVLDLFSGIGGFSLGLERSGGFETTAFCEIEDYPRKVLKKHWPDVPIYEDVRNVTRKQLEADGITGISVVTGGFPCQDISVAGKQAGIEAERSGLWSEIARLISELQPKYAIMENVSALISGDSGRWFGRVLGDLAEIGYDAEWHCIPASELGANHHRDRIWVIAHSKQIGSRKIGIFLEENTRRHIANDIRPLFKDISWWRSECGICRVDDGFSKKLDRYGALGNAVVPQIPEIIGRAIMEIENAP